MDPDLPEDRPLLFPGNGPVQDEEDYGTNQQIQKGVIVQEPTGTSWYASIFLVVNAALGAGLLHFPRAYDEAGGIVSSLILQSILIVFIMGALFILAYSSDQHRSPSYQDVVRSLCGKHQHLICSLCIILYMFGTCITFLIIIGDQFDRIFMYAYGPEFCAKWYFNRKFTIGVSAVVMILPLCFPKRIDFLKYPSALGVFGVLFIVVLMPIKYYTGNYEHVEIKTRPDAWTNVFLALPDICFGYQCHVSSVPIYSCLRKRNIREFTKTLIFGFGICTVSYSVAAVFGYLTFGTSVNNDILLSYDPKDPLILVAVIMIAAKMFTTYPILLFCGRIALDSTWISVLQVHPRDVINKEPRRRITQVLIWFTLTLVLALFIPNIGVVIQFLGGLAAVFIFVFPGFCLINLSLLVTRWNLRHLLQACLGVLYVVVGAFIFGLVTTQSIYKDVEGGDTSSKLGPCD